MEINKQKILETRLKAEELKKRAMEIWADSPNGERLTPLKDDPVMTMLLTATAYQGDEISHEINTMRESVMSQLAAVLVPRQLMNARPAAAMVEARMSPKAVTSQLGSNTTFTTPGGHRLTPLLRTTLYNAQVNKVVRLDGRRWKVTLSLSDYVNSLSGMTFAITDTRYGDLAVYAGKKELPLIRPWDWNNMPLCDFFDTKATIFNHEISCHSAFQWLDLLAQQELGAFVVDTHTLPDTPTYGFDNIDLTFEFSDIADDFSLDKTKIVLNTVPVANVERRFVSLSPSTPVARIDAAQFITLLPTDSNQRFRDSHIHLRRVAGDKAAAPGQETSKKATQPGVYVYLSDTNDMRQAKGSVEVSYLATSNADAAKELFTRATLSSGVPGVDTAVVVGKPVKGARQQTGKSAEEVVSRYYMVTNDRIVTPADIKRFCYAELVTRYSLSDDMITSVQVKTERTPTAQGCPLQTKVDITVINSPYTQKVLAPERQHIEQVMQRMISVRSAGIVPVTIMITIK